MDIFKGDNIEGDKIMGDKVVQHNYFASITYQNIIKEIKDHERYLVSIPYTEEEMRQELIDKINGYKEQEETFKREVVKLAETFTRIELNSDRLIAAKNLFDEGKYTEASYLLNFQDIQSEIKTLRITEESHKRKSNQINSKRKQLSNELLVKAQITSLMFDNINRIDDVHEYFQMSIQLHRFFENTYNYGEFLRVHENYKKAAKYFQQSYKVSNNNQHLKAQALHSIAHVLYDLHKYEEAIEKFLEAYVIWNNIIDINWHKIAPLKAITCNGLGNTYRLIEEYELSFQYHKEALDIRLELVKINKEEYQKDLALTYLNFAVLNRTIGKLKEAENLYRELIPIYQELIKKDSSNNYKYTPYLGHAYNNLGFLYVEKGEIENAQKAFELALEHYNIIAKLNPVAHEQYVGQTLINLGKLHFEYTANPKLALEYVQKTKSVLKNHTNNPTAKNYLEEANRIESQINMD